jgi:hypothetical protein
MTRQETTEREEAACAYPTFGNNLLCVLRACWVKAAHAVRMKEFQESMIRREGQLVESYCSHKACARKRGDVVEIAHDV